MKTLGYDQPLYILPFDHRGSFVTKMFGWHWLRAAAGVKGFIGFAVGRTVFWDSLVNFLSKKTLRDTAGAEIARRYREFVEIFEHARPS